VNNILNFIQIFMVALKSNQLPQLGNWTYLLLAVLVAVEGPIATLLGGVAASAGLMKLDLVFLSAVTGNLTADSLWYTLGYLGKIETFLRFGRRMGVSREMLEHLEAGIQEHATRILFIAKLTVSFVIPSLIAAGLVKAPWRRWFPAIFTGEMLWTGALTLIGFYATETLKRLEKGVEFMALGGGLIFVFFILFMLIRYLKKRYQAADLANKEQVQN
jgi:membrane protein DedA with SNARE-associated domain